MGTSKSFGEFADKMEQASINLRLARAASFRQAERDMLPRFRDEARHAAGPDRRLSGHRNKSQLDADFKIVDGRDNTFLYIKPIGPWGIRDSTDTSGHTRAHPIEAKRAQFLRFADRNGDIIFVQRVVHPGSARENFWGNARSNAVNYIRQRIPRDTHDAIEAALQNATYRART